MLSGSLFAQEQKSVLKLAEEAYAREEYAVAGALYKRQARSKGDKTPVPLLMKMAHSLRETGNFLEAASSYKQIVARPDHPASACFAYGETLRQLEQYDSARQQYNLFTTSNADSLQLKAMALQSCDSAALWLQAPASVQMNPVKELNTRSSDIVTAMHGGELLLMSSGYHKLLEGKNGEKDLRTQQPYYNAYAYRQNHQGNPTMFLEELAPALLGKYDYHIGPVCMSSQQDTLYATINIQGKDVPFTGKGPVNGVRQLQIFQSVKKDGKWTEPVLLPGINVAHHSSSHAVLNAAGNILYFVSDRPGGVGQTDIWYCEKQADGSWGTPVNCGGKINSVAAESFPTMNEGDVLYFSSKGHPGLGGYDIFRVKGEKSSWETPMNMKAPFNSGADDISFVLHNNGPEGYFASNRDGGMGSDDIYRFVDIDLFNRLNGIQSPEVTDHSVRPPANGENHQTPGVATHQPGMPRQLTAEEEADKQSLEQLKFLYDYNSARLLAESRQILDKAAEVMKRRQDWKIIISSYADNRGTDQYNTDLSARRCLSVIDYLAGKGIDPKRLYYANKGETEPVNGCKDGVPCDEDEYRQNRRSELKVVW